MEAGLEELERVQTEILQRISNLENSLSLSSPLPVSSPTTTTTEARLSAILRSNGVNHFAFKKVPSDYYDSSLQSRRDILAAASVDHLCKSIVLVNTQALSNVVDCTDPNNSKYYVVVVQYTARFNAETVKNFLYSLNNGKIPKKKFNLRLAPEETSVKLTGYEHNAVTCIGMKTDIPLLGWSSIPNIMPVKILAPVVKVRICKFWNVVAWSPVLMVKINDFLPVCQH